MRLSLQPWRYLTSTFITTLGGALLGVLAVTVVRQRRYRNRRSDGDRHGLSAAYGVIVVRTFLHGRYDTVELRRMLRTACR